MHERLGVKDHVAYVYRGGVVAETYLLREHAEEENNIKI